jgi:hypothetical protein
MTGRSGYPGGEMRRASQRHSRPAIVAQRRAAPTWQAGQPVSWNGRAGVFSRDAGDGVHAEIVLDGRTYRVRIEELA